MTKEEFVELMNYPKEWIEWDMYPPELAKIQISGYEPGNESGSEHDRNGAFHWWLSKNPDKEDLLKLVKLSYLDPDQMMGEDVRSHILKSEHCDTEVTSLIEDGL